MSQSRLNKSESRARSYLQQSIEYRKVFYKRNDHHLAASPPPRVPSHVRPTESRLERLINLDHGQSRSHERHLSLSPSQSGSRDYRTPLNHLPSPSSFSLSKNESYAALQRQQQPTPSSRNEAATPKQKLPLKQQKAPPISSQVVSAATSPPLSIEELTDRMNHLVNKKLQFMMDSLHNKKGHSQEKKREVNAQLQSLMGLMRQAQGLKGGDMHLLNQKIAFIETMMAEQNAEAEIMKKHYYHLSSNKIKGKVGDFTHQRAKVANAYKSLSHHPGKARMSLPKEELKKPLFKETTNKSSYKQPQSSDYESYRYRQKLTPMNMQPLPRSSYKRDFLILKSQPDQKIINRDHSPYNPSSKARVGSTYGQDYRRLKTETIDHRELDAFRDKIRTLKVSYMPQRRPEVEAEDRTAYREAVSMSRVRSNNSQNYGEDPSHLKRTLLSESRRQFQGEVAYEPSRIKHQQLQSFQYKLKHLFKL